MEEVAKLLRAVVALQVRAASGEDGAVPKPDLLLADLGFSAPEIARLTGKSVAAVSKAITRARAAARASEKQEASNGLE